MGVGGTAGVVTVTTTGVNIAGYANLGSGNLLTTGNVTANVYFGNGSQLTGVDAAGRVVNGTSNLNIATSGGNITMGVGGTAGVVTVTTTGVNIAGYANLGSGNLLTTGNASAGFFIGSGNNLSNIQGANVSGQVSNALIAGTVYTNAQPNITSVGLLTDLTVGNATANTIFGNGTITATGNISFTGANVSLGSTSSVRISGGAANYFLKTDGTGNLSWATPSGGVGGTSLTYTTATSPPGSGNLLGDQWFNTSSNVLYEYLNDGTAAYWVDVSGGTTTTNTSVVGAIAIQDEGTNLTTAVSSINFVGAGVTASNVGNAVTVTVVATESLSPFLLMGA
jgi:hypothetical protein